MVEKARGGSMGVRLFGLGKGLRADDEFVERD